MVWNPTHTTLLEIYPSMTDYVSPSVKLQPRHAYEWVPVPCSPDPGVGTLPSCESNRTHGFVQPHLLLTVGWGANWVAGPYAWTKTSAIYSRVSSAYWGGNPNNPSTHSAYGWEVVQGNRWGCGQVMWGEWGEEEEEVQSIDRTQFTFWSWSFYPVSGCVTLGTTEACLCSVRRKLVQGGGSTVPSSQPLWVCTWTVQVQPRNYSSWVWNFEGVGVLGWVKF